MDLSHTSSSLAYLKQGKPLRKKFKKVKDKPSRVEILAKPSLRRLEELWNEKGLTLSPAQSNNIKSILEANYFNTPERTEDYFRQREKVHFGQRRVKKLPTAERKEWLSQFSSQVASHLCRWVLEHRDLNLSQYQDGELNVRDMADAVLEKVANVLGERKPTRKDKSRLSRFMVAVSDRIAIWIEAVVKGANQGLSDGLLSLKANQ